MPKAKRMLASRCYAAISGARDGVTNETDALNRCAAVLDSGTSLLELRDMLGRIDVQLVRSVRPGARGGSGRHHMLLVLGDGILVTQNRPSRRLFEGDGTTLSKFVLGQRLVQAYRMLADPGLGHRTIGTLAVEVGFGDLSTFNREFRRYYGATPADVRAAASN